MTFYFILEPCRLHWCHSDGGNWLVSGMANGRGGSLHVGGETGGPKGYKSEWKTSAAVRRGVESPSRTCQRSKMGEASRYRFRVTLAEMNNSRDMESE